MNQVNLIGYLGKDWETSFQGEMQISKNFLAVTKTIKKGNDTTSHTDWIPLVCFGKRAETLVKYTGKGYRLCVSGEIYTSTYQNEQGENRTNWQVIVNSFYFLQNKEKSEKEAKTGELEIVYEKDENDNEVPF